MKNPELDLTHEVCHSCGGLLAKNIRAEKEWCINPICIIRNIKFSIPFIVEKELTLITPVIKDVS